MTEHDSIAAALVAALADLTVIEKGRTADAGSYSYDYADLGDSVKFTRPVLAEHGVIALTPVGHHAEGLAVTVKLIHVSGEEITFDPLSFPRGRDAQATGSAITYHRRYALQAALGIATGEDDDGAKASAAPPPVARGVTSAVAGEKLRALLDDKVPGDITEHAKAVWHEAQPKAADGLIPDSEVARLLKVADEYVADLAAMADSDEEPF